MWMSHNPKKMRISCPGNTLVSLTTAKYSTPDLRVFRFNTIEEIWNSATEHSATECTLATTVHDESERLRFQCVLD